MACLLQWGLARATGIAVGIQNLRYRPGRPARIAMLVAKMAGQQAALRGIRQDPRAGGGVA